MRVAADRVVLATSKGKGKTRRVVVKSGTPVTRMTEAGMAGLKAGSSVTALTTKGADGKPVANMILLDNAP